MQLNDFEYWIDANIPTLLAKHLSERFNIKAFSIAYLNMLDETDLNIFLKAKLKDNIIIITKDEDFVDWVILKNPPPKIIWITIGNVKNKVLIEKIISSFEQIMNKFTVKSISFVELN
jgi:predicted nuclease of predicted toxin-antitoxin system